MSFSCILCQNEKISFFIHQKTYARDFYQCENCELIFVDRTQIISMDEEKERYDLHENHIRSSGYEKFLRRTIDPLLRIMHKDKHGLDFGEGPYPMLREIMAEEGYTNMQGYDPIYRSDKSVLDQTYDFIICCEVIEHASKPKEVLEQLFSLLLPDGVLALSTGIYSKDHDFLAWQYTHDDTHINFFTDRTLDWVKKKFSYDVIKTAKDLIIFSKK